MQYERQKNVQPCKTSFSGNNLAFFDAGMTRESVELSKTEFS